MLRHAAANSILEAFYAKKCGGGLLISQKNFYFHTLEELGVFWLITNREVFLILYYIPDQ